MTAGVEPMDSGSGAGMTAGVEPLDSGSGAGMTVRKTQVKPCFTTERSQRG